jgi:hypothetical protein
MIDPRDGLGDFEFMMIAERSIKTLIEIRDAGVPIWMSPLPPKANVKASPLKGTPLCRADISASYSL